MSKSKTLLQGFQVARHICTAPQTLLENTHEKYGPTSPIALALPCRLDVFCRIVLQCQDVVNQLLLRRTFHLPNLFPSVIFGARRKLHLMVVVWSVSSKNNERKSLLSPLFGAASRF